MRATGIVRRIDELGRVVIPKEIRRTLRIREGDPLEIYTDRDGEVILKKYSPIGEMSSFAKDYTESLFRSLGHIAVIVDRYQVVAASGLPRKELGDKPIFLAAHDGAFDRATLAMSRCFFDLDGSAMGAVGLFSGLTEVKSCGGLAMKLTVKSKVQGMSQEFPRRRFYPQGTYANSGGTVSSSTEEDSASVIAPFVPLKEVLL